MDYSSLSQLGATFLLAMGLLEIIKLLISKMTGGFGFQGKIYNQLSNHIHTQLDELKETTTQGNKEIVKAITDMHIDLIKELRK